jgi:cobalt-zinc-cadmium efflux system outer membrane protein
LNRGFAIVILLLLAGCAHYQPRPISPADTAAKLNARSLDDPAFRRFLEKNTGRQFDERPLKTWDFNTLTLAAFYYHPGLEVARAQWQVALGGDKTAAQSPNPSVSAQPGYDFSATGGVNPWLPGVVFDIPIETMGKRGYRKAQAAHLSDSARRSLATTAWQVRSNLRGSLIDYVAARDRVELLQKQRDLQHRIVQQLDGQLQAGAVAAPEITPMKIALQRAELDLTDARRQQTDARMRVADAIGIPAKALASVHLVYDLAAKHPEAANLMSAQVRDEALKNRADILGALDDYAASQSALQLEIAKQYPDIHLGPYYQYNQGDHQFTLSVTVDLPILNQNQGPIAEAEGKRKLAAAQFLALQAKVMSDIDRAVAGYRVTRENLAGLEALGAAQKKQTDAVAEQLQAGAVAPFDLLNSQLELATGELAQLDGRVKLEQAYAALEDAVQRPLATLKPAVIEQPPAQAMKEKQP